MRIDTARFAALAGLSLAAPGPAGGHREGERRSRALGSGVEFADHRPYHLGDDLRRVDWNAWARLGQLLVRLHQADRNLRVHVVVDASASMGLDDKADHAASLAAGLALVGLKRRDSVHLACCGEELLRTSGHDLGAWPEVLRVLERARPGGTDDGREALRALLAQGRADRILLLSDLLTEDLDGVLRLMATGSRAPAVLHVLGASDREPDLRDAVRLADAETGEELVVPGGSGRRYREVLDAWQAEVADRCAAWGVRYVPAHTDAPVLDLLHGALRQAGLLTGRAAR